MNTELMREAHKAWQDTARAPGSSFAEQRPHRIAYARWTEVSVAARLEFEQLNGWHRSLRGFSIRVLSEGKVHSGGRWDGYGLPPNQLMDHPQYFRDERHRAIAIVAHLYEHWWYPGASTCGKLQGEAQRLGLVAHEHPLGAAASWYYPGGTRVVAFTRPGIVVRWP